MIAFIDDHRQAYGVEPICRELAIAPSTYYAHRARRADPDKASTRDKRDEVLSKHIQRIWQENFEVYGARKVWRQLIREGIEVARCTVERLMQRMGLRGAWRGKTIRTTRRDPNQACPLDHVKRNFHAEKPNALWVSDFTYVPTKQGFVYVAFVVDVFARYIVGWKVSGAPKTEFVLDALNQAVCERRPQHNDGLIHHSDHGVQYLSIRYTNRLSQAGIEASVGTVGDSYDNALAETINGLYKAEVIHRKASWKGLKDVELATLNWVDWFNKQRILEPIGNIPPAEAEAKYYAKALENAKVA